MDSLARCGTRAELERYVDECSMRQSAAARRLRDLSARAEPEKRLEDADTARTRLRSTLVTTSSLAMLLNTADQTTSGVASRIRDSQIVWQRAKSAREYVEMVLRLKDAVSSMYSAMDARDWGRASRACHEALQTPTEVLESEFAARMVPTIELPDAPPSLLKTASDDMAQLFSKEFDKATQSRNMDELTRYFKLFPLIGHTDEGLNKYSHFICQIVAGYARGLLTGDPVSNFYGAAMARLLEHVAAIMNQHAPLVTRYYTAAAMPRVAQVVQTEVDRQGGLIIDIMWDERRLERLLGDCRAYSFPILLQSFGGTSSTGGGMSPRTSIDAVEGSASLQATSGALSELTMILNRWSLYNEFMAQWTELSGGVSVKVSELLGPTFAALAVYVFRRSVEKAVQLDELPKVAEWSEDQPMVSSMVDDVMYVFSSLLSQAVETGVPSARTAAIQGFRRVLESDYIGTIQRKLRDASQSLRTNPLTFETYLNNIQLTAEYVSRATATAGDEGQALSLGFKTRADELLGDGCQTMASIVIAPHVRQAIATAFKGTYTPAPTDPESRRATQFEVSWRQLSRRLRRSLHPVVYGHVAVLASKAAAGALEKVVWALDGKVNELGAIALDRDIGRVIAVMAETQYALRLRFVRVAQMVTALSDDDISMESVPELTAEEVTKIRTMKVTA